MTITKIEEKVKAFLVEELEIDEDKVVREGRLKEDMGIDSLEVVDIAVLVEQQFGVKIKIEDFRVVGSGLVAVTVTGEVAAVQTSVDSGREAAERMCEVVSANVIPRPHGEVAKLLEP